MAPAPPVNSMSAEQSAVVAEFARACRGAARSVSLYPATHPAIQASLSRVTTAAARLVQADDLLLSVHPDTLVIDGRSPQKPDTAVTELAGLMHERLIGALRIERGADAADWHALLLLLARPAEELIAEGGIGKAWTASARAHFEIHEIDYAEVLRERETSGDTHWDAIIAASLLGDMESLDVSALLELLGDGSRFGEFLERLQNAGDASVPARVAAIISLLQKLLEATAHLPKAQGEDKVLQTAADAMARLTPAMLLDVLGQRRAPDPNRAQIASAVVDRVKDETIASFVAESVVRERGASERLAQAFEALVPEPGNRTRLLELARGEAAATPLGHEPSFEELWQSAATMLTSYSDEKFVSADYARELSGARRQAIDVERVSDDPPERLATWRGTVSDDAVKALDFQLVSDLLRVVGNRSPWTDIARVAATTVEGRIGAGDIEHALELTEAIARAGVNRDSQAVDAAMDALTAPRVIHQLVLQLRKADDKQVAELSKLCDAIGPRIMKPLAEALVSEDNPRTVRRLRELLIGFGAAGRAVVEQLRQSPNPAVRRTAVDLLRMFGGQDALPELATMLRDADPQVQREAVRAIVHTGSAEAVAVLQREMQSGAASAPVLDELIALRDERVVPILCSVLSAHKPRGTLVDVHTQIIEALGALGGHPKSAEILRTVLYRGEWWAPYRTAALRRAAATALKRIGTPETLSILDEAARTGSRGVRNAARTQTRPDPHERQHA